VHQAAPALGQQSAPQPVPFSGRVKCDFSVVFDLHLFYAGLVSYRTDFRQEQHVLQPTGKFRLNLAEAEITTKLNSYLFSLSSFRVLLPSALQGSLAARSEFGVPDAGDGRTGRLSCRRAAASAAPPHPSAMEVRASRVHPLKAQPVFSYSCDDCSKWVFI